MQRLLSECHLRGRDALFAAVCDSQVQVQTVLRAVQNMRGPERAAALAAGRSAQSAGAHEELDSRAAEKKKADSISISGGGDDILLRFAKCCNPVPGDHIIGYISRGRGITVHTADCPTILTAEPERLLAINWDGQREEPFPTRIHIVSKNIRGVLHEVSGVLLKEGVNIDSGSMRSNVAGRSEINLVVEVRDTVQLYQVMAKLRQIENVYEVVRSVAPDTKARQVEAVD